MAIAARLTDIDGHPIDRHMTADQFLELVDRLPHRAELIDGEVVVNSPSYRHQDVVLQLARRLCDWIDAASGRGKCGIDVATRLDGRNAYRPDLWWYGEERRPSRDTVHFMALPDIAVEVLSPSTRRYDLGAKRATYERLGLPELWIIDPMSISATLWQRSDATSPIFDGTAKIEREDSLTSPQLPGFAVHLADLFA